MIFMDYLVSALYVIAAIVATTIDDDVRGATAISEAAALLAIASCSSITTPVFSIDPLD